MPRFLSRSLAVTFFALAGLASARAEIASVHYLVPVTYDMVITRSGTSSSTTHNGVTTETSSPSFEIFTSKDLLKLILSKTADADVKGWSLYAVGTYPANNAESVPNPEVLETLELVARYKDGTEQSLPEGMTFSLSLSDTRANSSTAVHDDAADGKVLSERETITQLASLSQALPARGTHSVGTLSTIGYVTHGIVYGKVKIGGETTSGAITQPTSATYRAAGTFDAYDNSEDGLVEVLITFGTPKLKAVEATTPEE